MARLPLSDIVELLARGEVSLSPRQNSPESSTQNSAQSTTAPQPSAQSTAAPAPSAQNTAAQAPSPSQTPPASGNGISAGAVAGTAVGALVAGLLVGFLGAWLLLKRRSSSNSKAQYRSLPAATRAPEQKASSPSSQATTGATSRTSVQLDAFLLDGVPDDDIANELRSLSDLIYQHVENNYSTQPVQASAGELVRRLQALGFQPDAHHDPEAIAALVLDPRTRQTGLRHVISTVAFRAVDVNARSPLSMLPAPVAALLHSIPSSDQDHDSNRQAMEQALSNWRRLSAFLLHPHPSQRTPLPAPEAAVSSQALALTNALDTFLGSFVTPSGASRQGQQEHLQAVIVECTRLGYILFSHPSDWRFVYGPEHGGGRGAAVVVCAGLDRLSQSQGQRSFKPVLAPVVVEL